MAKSDDKLCMDWKHSRGTWMLDNIKLSLMQYL